MFSADLFLKAQTPVIEAVLSELRAGHKRTHWMWFIFPQLKPWGAVPPRGTTSWKGWTMPGPGWPIPC